MSSEQSTVREFLRSRSAQSVVLAHARARKVAEASQRELTPAHLLVEILADPGISGVLAADVLLRAKAELQRVLIELPKGVAGLAGEPSFDRELLFRATSETSARFGGEQAAPIALLITFLQLEELVDPVSVRCREALRIAGLTLEVLMPARTGAAAGAAQKRDFKFESLGFGRDLVAKAKAGAWERCPLVGMEDQLETLAMILCSGRDSIALVGEPGVGKSSLVFGLAWHIANRTRPLIPKELDDLTLVDISISSMLAGMSAEGELEERLEKMLAFFRANKNVVPFFDEMHAILDSEDRTARRIANSLKQAMAEGQFRLIGVSTDREYARYISGDPALDSRFTRVLVPEPDLDAAVTILEGVKATIIEPAHRHLGVEIPTDTVRTIVRLTDEHQRNDRLPRKAIRLLRQVSARFVYQALRGDHDERVIPESAVADTFSRITGIPANDLLAERDEYFERLRLRLGDRVFGQQQACDLVASQLRLHGRGWTDPRRPRGIFLFLGPPGTGKTELAMAIADELLHDRNSAVVKGMAEYRGDGARNKFMGADPGYIGFGQVETIYSHVMLRPYSVVVLDEFEKASAELSNPLLSVLSGAGEDGQGRRVDFSQSLFVLTSNAIEAISPQQSIDELRERLLQWGGIFTPPLLDRIDGIVVFNELDEAVLARILDRMIEARAARSRAALPEALRDPAVRAGLIADAADAGMRPSARGLERALSRWLQRYLEQEVAGA